MHTPYDSTMIDSDFRPQASLWIALGSLLLVSPFAMFHFVQQRPALGLVSLGVAAALGFDAWYQRRAYSRRSPAPRVTIAATGILLDLYLLTTQGTSGLLWGYPTVLWLYCTLPEREARIANGLLLICSLPLISTVASVEVATRAMATLTGVSLFSAVLVHVISRQQEGLQRQIRQDPLTGLLNRHDLDGILGQAIARASRDGTPMALLAIDIDHFKRINDDFGHAVGDDVLSGMGTLLHERLRASDIAFRIGGEEFLVLLHDTGDASACQVAEDLLARIREASLLDARPVTASIGLAVFAGERDPRSWIVRADEALYRAKASGRDRMVKCREPSSAASPGSVERIRHLAVRSRPALSAGES